MVKLATASINFQTAVAEMADAEVILREAELKRQTVIMETRGKHQQGKFVVHDVADPALLAAQVVWATQSETAAKSSWAKAKTNCITAANAKSTVIKDLAAAATMVEATVEADEDVPSDDNDVHNTQREALNGRKNSKGAIKAQGKRITGNSSSHDKKRGRRGGNGTSKKGEPAIPPQIRKQFEDREIQRKRANQLAKHKDEEMDYLSLKSIWLQVTRNPFLHQH